VMPGNWAAVPVPDRTTFTIIFVSSAATSGLVASENS
jgi:hypothetical protein